MNVPKNEGVYPMNITLKKASQVERMFYFLFTFC